VSDHNQSYPPFMVELFQNIHDKQACFCVHIAGRFVAEDYQGVISQGPGNSHALALAAGHFRWFFISQVFNADQLEQLPGFGFLAFCRIFYFIHGDDHVFQSRQVRQQVMQLENEADFMTADLAPNKIYYALVEPRMGVWKARFSFDPVHEEKVTTSDLTDWMEDCRWVEKTAESLDWAQENMPSIQAKLDKYYPVWLQKEQSKKQHLFPIDGK